LPPVEIELEPRPPVEVEELVTDSSVSLEGPDVLVEPVPIPPPA
jgi:hypothetical protein